MDTIVEILAALVVAMAAAALSLFGVKIDAAHATAPKPPVISRTSNATPAADPQEAARATPARPMNADCPQKRLAATATKA